MRTIIFDFDGTIVDSLDLMVEIGYQLTHHDLLINKQEIQRLRNLKLGRVAEELGIKKRHWPFLLYRGRRMMTKHINELNVFSGIEDVFKALQKDGYHIFIMSSNSRSNIESFLSKHGLGGYVERVYGNVGLFSKARAFRKILRQNRLGNDEVVYVGDEARDVDAAREENIACIAVGWGFNTPELLASHSPMVVVRTRQQLLKVLETWGVTEYVD